MFFGALIHVGRQKYVTASLYRLNKRYNFSLWVWSQQGLPHDFRTILLYGAMRRLAGRLVGVFIFISRLQSSARQWWVGPVIRDTGARRAEVKKAGTIRLSRGIASSGCFRSCRFRSLRWRGAGVYAQASRDCSGSESHICGTDRWPIAEVTRAAASLDQNRCC